MLSMLSFGFCEIISTFSISCAMGCWRPRPINISKGIIKPFKIFQQIQRNGKLVQPLNLEVKWISKIILSQHQNNKCCCFLELCKFFVPQSPPLFKQFVPQSPLPLNNSNIVIVFIPRYKDILPTVATGQCWPSLSKRRSASGESRESRESLMLLLARQEHQLREIDPRFIQHWTHGAKSLKVFEYRWNVETRLSLALASFLVVALFVGNF